MQLLTHESKLYSHDVMLKFCLFLYILICKKPENKKRE